MRNNLNGMNQQALMQNSMNIMAAFNAGNTNGVSTPPPNGLTVPPNGTSGSPRMGHMNQQNQYPNGSISQVPKLEAQIRASYPNATPEQIRKMVGDSINQSVAQQRQQISQSAMHAAAGGANAMPGLPTGMQNSPQQYAQMLRAQQERQAAAAQQSRSASAGSGTGGGK